MPSLRAYASVAGRNGGPFIPLEAVTTSPRTLAWISVSMGHPFTPRVGQTNRSALDAGGSKPIRYKQCADP